MDFLCRNYDIQPFFEPNEANPYLADFFLQGYEVLEFSFPGLLESKFRIHQDSTKHLYPVQDRTIYEDAEIFDGIIQKVEKSKERLANLPGTIQHHLPFFATARFVDLFALSDALSAKANRVARQTNGKRHSIILLERFADFV